MSTVASHGRPGKTQSIPYTATAASAAALGSQTRRIRLVATTGALVTIGDTVGAYLAPNFPEVFLCTPGQVLSVVQQSAAGTLTLTEIE